MTAPRVVLVSALALLSACASPAVEPMGEPGPVALDLTAELPACLDRAQVIEGLENRFEERLAVVALQSNGAALEVLVSPDQSFTILETVILSGKTCTRMVSAGQAWQPIAAGAPL